MTNLLEIGDVDEAWPRNPTRRIFAPPEAVHTLPFNENYEEVAVEERQGRFVMDLLVCQQEAHGINDERIPLITARHDAYLTLEVLYGILTAEFAIWVISRSFDRVIFLLFFWCEASDE